MNSRAADNGKVSTVTWNYGQSPHRARRRSLPPPIADDQRTCAVSVSGVAVAPAGLKTGSDCAGVATEGLAGWAGRNQAARTAPAAATPPATSAPTERPWMKAFVAAV